MGARPGKGQRVLAQNGRVAWNLLFCSLEPS